jgi:hypothetical protein
LKIQEKDNYNQVIYIFILGPIAAPQTSGVSLPVYYLKKFNAYYEGEWDAGQPSGLGKLYFANGAYF